MSSAVALLCRQKPRTRPHARATPEQRQADHELVIELVGVSGLEHALAPGAASPAFNLLVRITTGTTAASTGRAGASRFLQA
ncbi:hypothetical protein E2562_038931 [Oryza meyeriana var. granulata]|uniref:Uncharacterized protein n=1 Tax=Oryza meyeriana var. granulata TaxID=110450 RepID=A0A6G1E8T1_9ORYZ|nr:hypothetical protein E2562_038931 [Oryza meyeriana var. granulata]